MSGVIVKKFVTVVQRQPIEGDEALLACLEPLLQIETHMTMNERLRLFETAMALPPGFVACEIGSYLGASACFLGLAAHLRGGVVHCFDTWDNRAMDGEPLCDHFAAFMENIDAFQQHIVVHRGESSALAGEAPNAIDLLFLDGDHSYAGVKADLSQFGPKLKSGGFLLLHDCEYPGVQQASQEFLVGHPARNLGHTGSLQVFQALSA